MYQQRYVDVNSMSVSQSCLCSFLCKYYISNFLNFLVSYHHFTILSNNFSLAHAHRIHKTLICSVLTVGVAQELLTHLSGRCNDIIRESCIIT